MQCYIEVKRTEKCVACGISLSGEVEAVPVRIQDNMGYSISAMCNPCMDMYSEYKKKKNQLIGV